MSYQGSNPYGSDYAKSAVGVSALFISDKLFASMEQVIAKPHPEQSIIVLLQCLRKLAEEFPNAVALHFHKPEFERAKAGFHEWYEKVEKKIPAKYRQGLREEAEAEFERWENGVLLSK